MIQNGVGVTFVDVDDTMFRTFAKVIVKKNGSFVRELTSHQYNSDVLGEGEVYDFSQFQDANFFYKTSIPIPKTINRVKKMIRQIESNEKDSEIVFLTARESFDNFKRFRQTFEDQGVRMKLPFVSVIFAGDLCPGGGVEDVKKTVMMRFVNSGKFSKVRLLDDHIPNLRALKEIEKELPSTDIEFYALHVQPDGKLKRI